jgi:hypothetical protein
MESGEARSAKMDVTTVAMLTAFFGFLTAIVGLILCVMKEVRGVHLLVNSRMDELLALTKKAAHAAGVKEEKDRPS